MIIQSTTPKISVEFFTEEELDQIFAWILKKIIEDPKRSAYHKKYYLLLKVLLRTGARIDEALMLRPKDINLDMRTITLITLKKKVPLNRTLPLHPDLRDTIMQYYIDFNIPKNTDDKLFSITRQSADLYMKKLQSELKFRIHAHKFRHTFAVEAILSGVPVNVLQKWLGHASIFTTSVYTEITGMDTSRFMEEIK